MSCPRCEDPSYRATAPCPVCGYEPRHPGVLGAYREALSTLARRPALLVPYLAPVLFHVLATSLVRPAPPAVTGTVVAQVVLELVTLFLQAWWFLVALGITARVLSERRPGGLVPTPAILRASALGALFVSGLLAAVVLLTLAAPTGGLGALALIGSVVLAIGALLVAGRVVGLPVEAALAGPAPGWLAAGNQRAKENGGLGLVFLAFALTLAPPAIPIALRLAGVTLSGGTIVALGAALTFPLLAWAGTAMALALDPRESRAVRFPCPRCGLEAEAVGGRARCACGLEGPYYPA